jgi:hypothetical protein
MGSAQGSAQGVRGGGRERRGEHAQGGAGTHAQSYALTSLMRSDTCDSLLAKPVGTIWREVYLGRITNYILSLERILQNHRFVKGERLSPVASFDLRAILP